MSALALNIQRFAQVLRSAGLNCGPGQALAAVEAVALTGLESRADVYQALYATLVTRHAQTQVFDAAFDLFWRNVNAAPPEASPSEASPEAAAPAGLRRLLDALEVTAPDTPASGEMRGRAASMAAASHAADFAQMSEAEFAAALRAVEALPALAAETRTRRFRPSPNGARLDMRRTLRRTLHAGGDVIDLARLKRRLRPPPIVALVDISGSMHRYAEIFLKFLHALTQQGGRNGQRVLTFTFGTALTNVTRALAQRDADEALSAAGRTVQDWGGGTRIGEALKQFNFDWSRRVLSQSAVVLLMTDGLERGNAALLAHEASRLRHAARRVLWLNPLLRFEGFAPKATGIKALLPQVHAMLPLFNLHSLGALAASLAQGTSQGAHAHRWAA